MPSRNLPSFTRAEVEGRHGSAKSCYVTIGRNVYDVTDFAADHPGGAGLVLEHAGRDVERILKDGVSHTHSDAAYEILDESLVGYLVQDDGTSTTKMINGSAAAAPNSNGHAPGPAKHSEIIHPRTGMSCEDDLSRETDYADDYRRHRFLDLSRPMFPQIWYGGYSKDFYLDQVHRPRHYRAGRSAPLFGNFLEPLSKTPWWVVPLVWLPAVAFGVARAAEGLSGAGTASYWAFGVCFWTLIEYILHRFLFHLDKWLPDNRVGITAHFLMHGIHHYLPMDKYRLVMPPTLFLALAAPFWPFAHCIIFWDWHGATAAFSGGLFGYVCYDLTHYFLHHENLPLWYRQLKKYHLEHHFLDYELGFGVTSRFWDRVFGTELQPQVIKAS